MPLAIVPRLHFQHHRPVAYQYMSERQSAPHGLARKRDAHFRLYEGDDDGQGGGDSEGHWAKGVPA